MKRRGCVEIVWGDCSRAAAVTEDALNVAMEAYARGEADDKVAASVPVPDPRRGSAQ
jgi:hypothetical protein